MHKFQKGDKVRIRTWESMEAEYGLDKQGDIKCKCAFVRSMKIYCGKIFTVSSIYSYCDRLKFKEDSGLWTFYANMVEKVEQENG